MPGLKPPLSAKLVIAALAIEAVLLGSFTVVNYRVNLQTRRELAWLRQHACIPRPGQRTAGSWRHGRLHCERKRDPSDPVMPRYAA
ncbi:MAG: hypothetical protein M0037_15165 [Betaproteobacteria bacterium]|nr:hypothetical protein [Betaproteobacteria bacterium]